jgi:hypothetical protein
MLMGKPKVQPFVSLIRGCLEVMYLLLLGHGIPFRFTTAVALDVVNFGERIEENINNQQA